MDADTDSECLPLPVKNGVDHEVNLPGKDLVQLSGKNSPHMNGEDLVHMNGDDMTRLNGEGVNGCSDQWDTDGCSGDTNDEEDDQRTIEYDDKNTDDEALVNGDVTETWKGSTRLGRVRKRRSRSQDSTVSEATTASQDTEANNEESMEESSVAESTMSSAPSSPALDILRREPRAKMCMSPGKPPISPTAVVSPNTSFAVKQAARKSISVDRQASDRHMASILKPWIVNRENTPNVETDKENISRVKDTTSTPAQPPKEKKEPSPATKQTDIRTMLHYQGSRGRPRARIGGKTPKKSHTTTTETLTKSPKAKEKQLDFPALKPKTARKTSKTARKSFHPPSTDGSQSQRATSPTKIAGSSLANMTLRLKEIERTLGIKSETLSKIDAKTLDKLILEKANMKSRESTPNRDNKITAKDKIPDKSTEVPSKKSSPDKSVAKTEDAEDTKDIFPERVYSMTFNFERGESFTKVQPQLNNKVGKAKKGFSGTRTKASLVANLKPKTKIGRVKFPFAPRKRKSPMHQPDTEAMLKDVRLREDREKTDVEVMQIDTTPEKALPGNSSENMGVEEVKHDDASAGGDGEHSDDEMPLSSLIHTDDEKPLSSLVTDSLPQQPRRRRKRRLGTYKLPKLHKSKKGPKGPYKRKSLSESECKSDYEGVSTNDEVAEYQEPTENGEANPQSHNDHDNEEEEMDTLNISMTTEESFTTGDESVMTESDSFVTESESVQETRLPETRAPRSYLALATRMKKMRRRRGHKSWTRGKVVAMRAQARKQKLKALQAELQTLTDHIVTATPAKTEANVDDTSPLSDKSGSSEKDDHSYVKQNIVNNNHVSSVQSPALLQVLTSPIMSLAQGSSSSTLEDVKADLDAQALDDSSRRSRRKRKTNEEGSEASVSECDSSQLSCNLNDSLISQQAKRRKVGNVGCMDDGIHGNASPYLSPIKPFSAAEGCVSSTPPIISPQRPLHRKSTKSKMPLGASQSRLLNGDEDDDEEEPALLPELENGSEIPLPKFINTPNGITYPATPPDTPDFALSQLQVKRYPGLEQEQEFIPLCCCKISGALCNTVGQVVYCQALDSIDGKVVGCCNKVTHSQLVRPAVKIPFMAVCESHRKRLKLHQCCPGCGHFCTQGKFYQCRKEGSSLHHFHKQCQVYKDGKFYCPHCGEESIQYESVLKLSEPRSHSFFLKDDSSIYGPRAKMSYRALSSSKKGTADNSDDLSVPVSHTIKKTGKQISSSGLPLGPDRTELENALAILDGDKPKTLRAVPKSMFKAVKNSELEKLLFMLSEGIDPNHKFEEHNNQTALHAAAMTSNFFFVHILLQAGAVPDPLDDDLKTPLMLASESGKVEIIKLLIHAGANPTAKGEDGMTSLHITAKNGHVEVLKYMLFNCNLDVNLKDDGGWTPIIWASEYGHVATVRFLMSAGADPNIRDNEENTGLHWAAYAGSVDIAELYLNAGCDLEAANEHGDRVLHIAARQDHYESVVLFLARGADSEARNNENEAPISCCADQNSKVWMALRVNRQLKTFAAQKLARPERLLHRDISMGREGTAVPVVNDFDNENYPTDFQYVIENVETSPMNINRVITSLQSCKCKDDCASMFCVCGRNSVRCWYDKEGRLMKDFNLLEPPLLFECNKACKCWANCQNRVVQLGITCRLQVFRTNGRGWGCRTLLDIQPGTFVCEYIGEYISDAEADSREDDSYLFDLDNKDSDTFCIDARRYGNVARFVNHLCEPNLMPVKVFCEHQDLRFPRICFFASRPIKAGEELGFDYGEKFWIIKWKQFTCECGSPKCKYNKDTIHQTIADYNRRQLEEEALEHE